MKYNIKELVYPFNERGKIEQIKDSKEYKILLKLCNDKKITNEEKQFITDNINNNTYFKDSIALYGVRLSFYHFIKRYWFKSKYGNIYEQYAFNKTTLREYNKFLYPILIKEI